VEVEAVFSRKSSSGSHAQMFRDELSQSFGHLKKAAGHITGAAQESRGNAMHARHEFMEQTRGKTMEARGKTMEARGKAMGVRGKGKEQAKASKKPGMVGLIAAGAAAGAAGALRARRRRQAASSWDEYEPMGEPGHPMMSSARDKVAQGMSSMKENMADRVASMRSGQSGDEMGAGEGRTNLSGLADRSYAEPPEYPSSNFSGRRSGDPMMHPPTDPLAGPSRPMRDEDL
jgi:hypothetical protein